MSYAEFLASKALVAPTRGLSVVPTIGPHLFPFQAECVRFGLQAGSFGMFLNTGLGKTVCELEWSLHAAAATNGRALILTPLAVARQIEAEGHRFGYPVRVIRTQAEAGDGINICNYDRLHLLEPSAFGSVALDEASILKHFIGSVSQSLIQAFSGHRFRCAATATPAPNDHTELAQHAAFLGVSTRTEMLTHWFINDSGDTSSWRLKGHAVVPFFDWMSSWARMAVHPKDLGDPVSGFDLPPLEITRHQAEAPETPITGGLFGGDVSATGIHDVKRQTIAARAAVARAIIDADPDGPWLLWVDTDYESAAVVASIPGMVEIRGSQTLERKEQIIEDFCAGRILRLTGKPGMIGLGLNLQFCHRMIYVGRSFSYEQFYQSVRRCWRFGQTRPVHVHLIVAEGEDAIGRVIDRKAEGHAELQLEMVAAMRRAVGREQTRRMDYHPTHAGRLPDWMTR